MGIETWRVVGEEGRRLRVPFDLSIGARSWIAAEDRQGCLHILGVRQCPMKQPKQTKGSANRFFCFFSSKKNKDEKKKKR
jgi:hypothetical protein